MHKRFIVAIVLASLLFTAVVSTPTNITLAQHLSKEVSANDDLEIYLPVILRPIIPSVFGVETYMFTDQNLGRARQAGVYWIRSAVFDWSRIEAVRGAYDWSSVSTNNIIKLSHDGYKLIATIKFTPSWAQKWPTYSCGPIATTAWNDFYNFVYALVQRYSVPPYNIEYWEFGNEPDVDPKLNSSFLHDNQFGCWGDSKDTYYGGSYYGEMLKRAYPAVKAASPTSKVLIGGLLLDCDPTHPPAEGCKPGKFFEGILKNGGGAYFDIVAFHSYIVQMGDRILDEGSPKWEARQGQITGKINFLREVMASYNTNKPLMLTELAMKWKSSTEPPTEEFLDFQADVVVTSFTRIWGEGLLAGTWYTLEDTGWMYSALFMGNNPKPAYHTMVFMENELHDCTFNRKLTLPTGLRGYEFRCPYKKRNIQVIWSADSAATITMPKPAGLLKMYDKFGNEVSDLPDPLSILHPVYLEFEG